MCLSSDPDGDRLVFFFDFGDKATAQGGSCRTTHTYGIRGMYSASVCVWDRQPEHELNCKGYKVLAR